MTEMTTNDTGLNQPLARPFLVYNPEKNIMIYSLHRSRGNALLSSCLRPFKMCEPFNTSTRIWPSFPGLTKEQYWAELDTLSDRVWSEFCRTDLISRMELPNTVVKIHGTHLTNTPWIREWWSRLESRTDWRLVTLERKDRLAQMISFVIALKHRFSLNEQLPDADTTPVPCGQWELREVHRIIEDHLKWYPKTGEIITYSTRPKDIFQQDPARILQPNQHSDRRVHLIEGGRASIELIRNIVEEYRKDWDQCILSRDPEWQFDDQQEPSYYSF